MEAFSTDEIVHALESGEVGVIPTDTQYGLVASALDPDAVERVYELRQRDPEKPLIVLVADIEDLERFGVILDVARRSQLERFWPGPVSLILPTEDEQFSYLHRDKYTICFRIPDNDELRALLRAAGPLVAPSANLAGDAPAKTIADARRVFGTDAAFYVDRGALDNAPSTIIDLSVDHPVAIRGNMPDA